MADSYQIRSVMQGLGTLWAAEHHEGDDDGVKQIENLAAGLRRFKQHEDTERDQQRALLTTAGPALREATYQLADGRHVYYDDGHTTIQDAADLCTVLPEDTPQGSPNLENLKARHILDRLQTGEGLGETHIGELRELLRKHADKVGALRASPDRHGQNPLHMASAGPDSRIIDSQETANVG